jgi:ribonuclease HI
MLTTINMRTNAYWGDELKEKAENTIRVMAANVNGFSLDRRGGQYDNYCRVLRAVQVDIACGQEHNLDTTKSVVRSILHNTTQQHWQRNRITFSSTPLKFENLYKPGGTFILSVGNITSRMSECFQDKWGRWTSQTYRGRDGRSLTVISAYQVVTDHPARGTTTAAAQQYSLLLQTKDPLRSPRAAFRRDLMHYIKQCQSLGQEILLTGDFNERINQEPDGMCKVIEECHLVDIMTRSHPGKQLPNTYARGHRCLDYALATEAVAAAVQYAGYEPFNSHFPTDHRPYFVDLSISSLFGIQLQPLAKYEPRVLQATNIHQVTTYIEKKYEYLCQHNVFERVQRLSVPGNRHLYAERLDNDVVAASLAAEQKITRFGEPQWSKELASARKKAQVLQKQISMMRTGIANHDTVQNEWSTIGGDDILPSSLRECSTLLRITKKEIMEIVSTSFQRREQERQQLIVSLMNSGKPRDQEQATRLRNLQKSEAIKQLFQKLKSLQLVRQKSGVTCIEIPSPPTADPKTCTDWVQIDIPTEVVFHLHERNRRHFGQAAGSPFTVPPLSTQLGYDAQSDTAEQILQGEYRYDGNDPNVHLLLQFLNCTADIEQLKVETTISEKEFTGKLRAWRESTSTSPSGLHLGHYKALIARHRYSSIPEDEDEEHRQNRDRLNRMQRELLDLHLTLLNYALTRGYSYDRWKKVANTILFKDPGVIKIYRTRVIHLYEADYNLAMGLKWRAAVFRAETLQLLHNGQFGSRPRRNAINPVFIKELQFELSRLTRKTVAQTNYDATACYDRIIPNLAMLASRRFGVPKEVTASNARTLEQASYHVRTELGVSPVGYQHSEENPIFGTGQGSANSPAIWCFLSSLLYQCYDTLAVPASYCSPNKTGTVELGMVGFVDDSNGQTNAFMDTEGHPATIQQIRQSLRHNAQAWANLLGATGGALELSKCSVHVATWAFTMQGAPVLQADKDWFDNIVVVDPTSGAESKLQYLSPYTAHKTLGHFKEPAGTQRRQFDELMLKSNEATAFLDSCSLTRSEAWTYYYACYLPSIAYPLANCHFTEQHLSKIQRKAMSRIVSKCGYNRHTKKEILYGPLQYGGANFRHLFDQQGLGQLTLFLRHWRQQTVAGQLLKNVVAWAQFTTGMAFPILETPSVYLPHLESKWLKSLRGYLASTKAALHLDATGLPPLEREHDGYIMEWIVHSNLFEDKEVVRLNYCRLFLNAVTLSDLTTTDGKYLDNGKLTGEISMMSSQSQWMSVLQDKPSETEWRLWRKANKIWSMDDGTLRQPLGDWLHDLMTRRISHFAYLDKNNLFIRTQSGYIRCRLSRANKYRETGQKIPKAQMPIRAKPVEVIMPGPNEWAVTHTTNVCTLMDPRQRPVATFDDYLATLEAWEYDLLRHSTLFSDAFTISEDLRTSFVAGSDGSEKYGTDGAFGWMISNAVGERAAAGMGPSRGWRMDSYRAECSGMLSLLRFLIRVGEYTFRVDSWCGTIGTDSQSMLEKLFGQSTVRSGEPLTAAKLQELDVMVAEWDLLREIQESLRTLPEVTLKYVKGHQDVHQVYTRLTILAQLNVDADDKASEYQQQYGKAHPFVLMSPHAGAFVTIPEGTITAKVVTELRGYATGPPLRSYIQQRNHWTDRIMSTINWNAHGKALNGMIVSRVHLTKLVHEHLPTFQRLNKFINGERKCPACHNAEETRDHILRCPHVDRSRWRTTFMAKLDDFHQTENTSPMLKTVWREAMELWFAAETPDIHVSPFLFPTEVRQVVVQQNAIGWRQVFNGRFALAWAKVQDDFLARQAPGSNASTRRGKKGKQWQKKFIIEIWKQWMVVWKSRNAMVHGKNLVSRKDANRRSTEAALRDIYDRREQLEPEFQPLLYGDVQAHIQRHHPSTTKNWIQTNAPILRESLRRAKRRAITGVRSIRSYFAPVR